MLTQEQREQFLAEGHFVVRRAFPRADAITWVREECAREGYDLDDPQTWTQEYVRIQTQRRVMLEDYAPASWEASCDLMGGPERVARKPCIDLFAVNFRQGADKPYRKASADVPGWHKDGWQFRHFLDSWEQGLLGIPLLTDVLPEGGGTFIAADSVPVVARFLAEHPEGVLPDEFPFPELAAQCRDFREVTGEAGDFFLLHPYLLHAVSQNRLRRPRAICNVLYELTEPMNLDRADGDYSPVEAAVLRGLGMDHYNFQPTQPRYRTPDGGPINPAYRKSK